MSQPKQMELFDLESVKKGEEFGKRHYWYYVTDARNMLMVVGLSPDGSPIMGEHDTRSQVGLWPHLFNTMGEARRYRDKYVKSGNVKRWNFSYK